MVKFWASIALGSAFGIGLLVAPPVPEVGAQTPATPASADTIERGRYLVNEVAQCIQCHSPRTRSGEIDRSKLMHGAAMEAGGPPWVGDLWASHAPSAITFARGRTDYTITLLTTGARPDGSVPKSPMPQYRLAREDAEAIVAYLKTLD